MPMPAICRLVCLLASALVAAAVGCRNDDSTSGRVEAERLGQLPGLRQAAHPELQAELARLVETGATPAQLTDIALADKGPLAKALIEFCPRAKAPALRNQSDRIFPNEAFEFSPARLHDAIEMRRTHEAACRRLEELRERHLTPAAAKQSGPGNNARPATLGISLASGDAADLSAIDAVRILARLEAFRAAEALAANDPAAAARSVASMFRWSQCLNSEYHPQARLEAALLRADATVVLRAVVEHPQTAAEQIEQLITAARQVLEAWPDDAKAWIGERALGLFVYELVRSEVPAKWLTGADRKRLPAQLTPEDFLAQARRGIDGDELYYLKTMQRVIGECDRPYYQRASLFQEIRNELRGREDAFDYPCIAGRLLLSDLEKGHLMQARDRVNCEVWFLALSALADRQPAQLGTNRLTGKPYQVDRQPRQVVVRNAGGEDGLPEVLIVNRSPR